MARVDLTRAAESDLKETWDYVALDSEFQADKLIHWFAHKFDYLAAHNGLGRPRPELAKDCRSYPLAKYCVYYRQTEDGILVLRLLHSARDIRQIEFLG